MRSSVSAVKQLALTRGFPVYQPERLRSDDADRVKATRGAVLIVAAYGLLLPQAVLDSVTHGAWNIHASLLPRWRGAAPIQRALLAGDSDTGISIMQMDAGLDTGPVLCQRRLAIAQDETAGSLHDKLAALGAEMIAGALEQIEMGRADPVPQPSEGVTYARKIEKHEARLAWARPAVEVERAVRAFNPSPGATATLQTETLKIWRSDVVAAEGRPGSILRAERELIVACGEQGLRILELQRPGGKRLDAAEFLRGRSLPPGATFA